VGRSRVAVSNLVRLLDLPEEALELLDQGALSEGHGRALLLAEDHAARRRLARRAATEAWSVRTLEARARASNAPARSNGFARERREARAGGHVDQEHAAQEIAEALSQALGVEVRVRVVPEGGYRAEVAFSSPAEALELAGRVRARLSA